RRIRATRRRRRDDARRGCGPLVAVGGVRAAHDARRGQGAPRPLAGSRTRAGRASARRSMSGAGPERDVVIVGAGVVGAAIARELSRFELRCTLIDSAADVGARTSKANTALLHTGFD